jgi:DNA-binding NarL/FixJ family response regulator
MCRVGIVEDHEELRVVLQLLLNRQTNIDLVFVARNGLEAIEGTIEHQPDVLVMDVRMPELNGLKATKQIADLSLPTRVILITSLEGAGIIKKAMAAGAYGFVHKSTLVRLLPLAVESVCRGDYFFPEEE